jgi:RHS repeat-associated protein
VNESASVDFERDLSGNIIKESINDHWVANQFDEFSNREKTISSLGAEIAYGRNAMAQLTDISANGWSAKFHYDKLSLEEKRELPGGVFNQWERDSLGRPIHQRIGIRTQIEGNIHRSRKYKWDVNYKLRSVRDEEGETQFHYDACLNLSETIFADGEHQLRNPDAIRNLFLTTSRADRVYTKGGQLKNANGWEYHHDAEGNLVSKIHANGDKWHYTWNDAGFLTEVTKPDRTKVYFEYDALGRRVTKCYKNTLTKFVWDGNVPVHEWKEHAITREKLSDLTIGENGIITWIFEEANFAPVAKLKGDKRYSIISDHLGTPITMYKSDGSLVWDCKLDSYGNVRTGKGESGCCPFRYQGQYEDTETGLYYNRFRYYAPEEGIYISSDPIGLAGGIALYGYVNDPNKALDPLGLANDESVYQLKNDKGEVVYYGITNDPQGRANEHKRDGKDFSHMEVIASDLNHDQARSLEGALIRERLRERVDDFDANDSVEKKLEKAGLLNKNRGRDQDRWNPKNPLSAVPRLEEPNKITPTCKK